MWYLEPAEAEWKLIQGSKVITKGYRVSQLGPGRGVLKIGGQKWAVRHAFDDRQVETAKENLVDYLCRAYYAVIITALEDGSFSRLGHCQKCKKFFVGQRRGVKYCSEECMKLADRNRAVTVRVPRWRDRQREFRD